MATFDELIQDIGSQYSLGPKASPLVQETLALISGQPGGMDAFLDRYKAAGFAAEVASWSGGTEVVPLSGQEVEATLGSDVISEIANKVGISQSFARTIMGYAIPKIIVLLAQGEAVPPAIPASESSVLDSAIQLSFSPVEEIPQPGAEQIRPSRTEHFAAAPPKAPPRFKQLFSYGSRAALAACLFGFAWAAGSYFSSGQSPFDAIKPPPAPPVATQESVARTEMLRAAEEMAKDIRALKANVEALRAAQSQSGSDASALEGLKTRLDAVKAETGAAIAELMGEVENLQREPEAKLSQVIERLDRIEHQIAAPLATASIGAAPVPGKAAAGKPAQIAVAQAKPPLENAHGQRKIGGRGDAFDPSQNPTAPGVPRPLGSLAPAASTPQLITNWVVRDVNNGIALVESPRGSIEVAPGEIIPGAGTVKSIERRGRGWIVITSRGLIDSARTGFQP
ncbi:MAG TPA: YidB family protein [Methylocella sp.]|nr:YidB family protein [Methylocella sp.]